MIAHLRATVTQEATVQEDTGPTRAELFRDGGRVPYEWIADDADTEYERWRTVPTENIEYHCDLKDKIVAWVGASTDEELSAVLSTTLPGTTQWDFTPWQRLYMAFGVSMPVDVTSRIHVENDAMVRITGSEHYRKQVVHAQKSMAAHGMPSHRIVDLSTGMGKTPLGIAMGYMVVSPHHYPRFTREYRRTRLCDIVDGPIEMPFARLVLVAATSSTFAHFASTLGTLLPAMRAHSPDVTIDVWTTMSARYSVRAASERPGIVFWICVGKKDLVKILRAHPDVGVAVCVTDEMPPKQSGRKALSPVLKHLVLNATPQALHEATYGQTTWFRDLMGGMLQAPCRLRTSIKYHHFSEAQMGSEQACLLDMMTLSPLRDLVRRDLRALVPHHLDVHVLRSRRLTLSAVLVDSSTDFVPASFANLLASHLNVWRPDPEQMSALREYVTGGELHVPGLVQRLRSLVFGRGGYESTVARLTERIGDAQMSCPICMEEDTGALRLFGCCGCVVCADCFPRCTRCPMCRTAKATQVRREDAGIVQEERPAPLPEVVPTASLAEALQATTRTSYEEARNLELSLHCLVRTGHRRLLVFVETPWETSETHVVARMRTIFETVGVSHERVDTALRGKGTKFAAMEARFNEDGPACKALLCIGETTEFLVGANLTHADALVTVGHIPDTKVAQALGRVMRPRVGRDNTKPIPMVRVHAGR